MTGINLALSNFCPKIFRLLSTINVIIVIPAIFIIIIIIIIIIIGKDTISFMQGIYTYIPETNLSLRNTMLQLFCRYCVWCPHH
jgi:hypothetical protein